MRFLELFFESYSKRDRVAAQSQNVTGLILWVSDVTSNQRAYWKPGVFYFTFPVFPYCLHFCQSQETYVLFHAEKSGSKLEINSKSFCMTNFSRDICCWNVYNQFQWCSVTAYLVITFSQTSCPWNRFPPKEEQLQKAKDRRCLQITFL